MLKKIKKILVSKQGISLMETLIALTILTIIAFCFLPLFAQYMNHIKQAGKLQQETQYKVSLMERLIANKGDNPSGYEVGAGQIPLTFYCGGTEISFNTNEYNTIKGTVIKSDDDDNIGAGSTYATFSASSAAAQMVSFPTELTDDFVKKDIYVVAKGFKFADSAFASSTDSGNWHFAVGYTDSEGKIQKLDKMYYDIEAINDNGEKVAKFTFYGGNEYVTFENSPFVIGYGHGSSIINLEYTTKLRISAPEIIFVGEKAKNTDGSDDDYYYYATSGVDEDGNIDIVAKKMTGSARLTSAMNDVEWVPEGRGDDGKGGVNKYGYYIMGGDAGQVRRFWMKKDLVPGSTSENFCWGGDVLNNYDRRYDIVDNNSYENFDKKITTQAMFKTIYRGDAGSSFMHTRASNGTGGLNQYQYSVFVQAKTNALGHKYQAVTMNNFTANVTGTGSYYVTMSGALKGWTTQLIDSNRKQRAFYGLDTDESREDNDKIIGWLSTDVTGGDKLNADGYKEATEYEYPNDKSLITITSVGAVQINKENSNYYGFQSDSFMKQNGVSLSKDIYPTQSYTLYCGYIPFVTDLYGWKTSNAGGWSKYVHLATLGVAYSAKNNKWYPTGKFGDLYTTSDSLSKDVFPQADYQTLLNYYDTTKFKDNKATGKSGNSVYPYPDNAKGAVFYYKPGVNGVLGQALGGQGQDYYLTGKHEVDVTTGYLSEPYAISAYNPIAPDVSGAESASNFYHTFNGVGNFGHSYTGAGLRENVTLLDVKSYYDDLTGNNISFAVGYSLSYLCNDYYWSTRLGQAYNTGIVYIRAVGDGTENDKPEYAENVAEASGRGWSLKKEPNIFHQFYGIDQYQNSQPNGKTGISALGWDTYYHRAYFNVSSNSEKAPQIGHSPSIIEGTNAFGTSCHPLADTECKTVNKGLTWDEKPEIMWGTANGTLLGWTYDYEDLTGSKITAVRKEFESYMWADRIGALKPLKINPDSSLKNNFYDYMSVNKGRQDKYGFISVLKSVNDVAYGDGFWVAVGDQSGKAPYMYCASEACYTGNGKAGSYINVKYDTGETQKETHKSGGKTVEVDAPVYAWKAVKVSDEEDINFTSVTYSNGVWYALGYKDRNGDGENNRNGEAYIYYSRNPAEGWERAKTRDVKGNYTTTATAVLFDTVSGKAKEIKLTGLNSMASRG